MRNQITDKQLNLHIGIFSIQISKDSLCNDFYYLPDSANQFIENKLMHSSQYRMNYKIQLDDSVMKRKSLLITGFMKGPFPYRIYRMDEGDVLWIRENKCRGTQLAYRISGDWNNYSLVMDNTNSLGSDSFTELAYIFAYSLLNKGAILFHGVVMEWQGMGIILSAYSGVGKTTHARMWRDLEDALILNGDRALCCKEENQWFTYGAPWSGSSGEHIKRKTVLKAIVILEQSETNEAAVLSPIQGAMELIQHAFAPCWDEHLINCAFDTIDNIIQCIPVIKLLCRPDLEAVSVLKTELEKLKSIK